MPIILSKLRMVSRTDASALDAVDAFEPLSNHSCSFWTWQCGHSCAAFGGAPAPAPAHVERTGASTRGRRRSREVPSPATYVGVAEGARIGAAPAESASPGSSASSSMRYHRRAETHEHSTHAPPTMGRPEGAGFSAAGFSASTAKRTATSSSDAATGADISDKGAVRASRPRDVGEGATVPVRAPRDMRRRVTLFLARACCRHLPRRRMAFLHVSRVSTYLPKRRRPRASGVRPPTRESRVPVVFSTRVLIISYT